MERLTRRELVLGAGALALGASGADALAMPARDPGWGIPTAAARAGGAGPRALRELARRVRGPVVRPGSAAYAGAARVYNTRFDGARPDAVIEPLDTRDVQAVLRWADRHDVRVAARSGGHSYAGYSTVDEGVVVDLRRLRAIAVHRGAHRASIGAGAHMIEVSDALARHGGAVPGGSCPTVGFGGLALGGGYGLAARAFGMTADNVIALVVVTPDGRRRRVDARHDPDLFWALRGGGGGNFGIVTRFEVRVHRVGRAAHFSASFASAGQALAAWEAWAPEADPRLTSVLQLGTGSATAVGQFLGPESRLAALLGPLRRAGASVTTGSSGYGALQVHWGNGRTTPRTTFSAKSHYVRRRLPGHVRDALVAELARGGGVPGLGTGMLILDAYGGAPNRPRPGASAFVHRDERYSIQYLAYHDGDGAPSRAWLRRMHGIVAPHASGAYQNYMDPELRGWRRAYYGRNLERLEAVRARYDPDRRFRSPRGI
jgi:FAD/FMN-containing dehydrogenase